MTNNQAFTLKPGDVVRIIRPDYYGKVTFVIRPTTERLFNNITGKSEILVETTDNMGLWFSGNLEKV